MNVSAMSSKALAIALAAISVSGSAGAGPLLCERAAVHESVQSSCPDSDGHYVKTKHGIDYLFDARMPPIDSVLSDDWSSFEIKFKPGKKSHERLLHLWHPLWSSDLSLGLVFDGGGKWTQPQLHGGQPSRSVPEPGPLLLLGLGLVGAALTRRLK